MEATAELEAVAVTALDANHCPGSAMLLFEIRRAGGDTVRVLHSGDMRFAPKMRLFPELRTKEIHQLFLDTTYCNPKYVFPPQENMTIWIAEKVRTEWAKMPKALFVVGTYTIGKEKVLLEIRRLLGGAQQGTKVYANAEKRRILKMLQLVEPAEFESVFTGKEDQSRIHIVKLGELGFQNMDALCEKAKALGYQRIIGFKPTGWTFNSKKQVTETKKGIATVYGVPYSEHSNFEELKEFVKLVRPRKLIPTVNCESKVEREEMAKHFQSLMNHSSNPGKIANYFGAKKDRGDSRAREETLAKNPPSNTIQHQNLREPKRSKTEQANQQNILTYFVQK